MSSLLNYFFVKFSIARYVKHFANYCSKRWVGTVICRKITAENKDIEVMPQKSLTLSLEYKCERY